MPATLSPLPSSHPELSDQSTTHSKWNILPFPTQEDHISDKPTALPLPTWPSPTTKTTPVFIKTWPATLATLPISDGPLTKPAPPATSTSPITPPVKAEPSTPQAPPIEAPVECQTAPISTPSATEPPDFTDEDLRQAFSPIVEEAVRKAVYAQHNGIDTYLEPMLRATIRRALAEYAPAARPFQPPGAWDRFLWHVQALFTSRTYEDIFFEKTRRFQVEEVFLLDATTLALISYASCDPARHSSVRRVTGTVQRLALQLRDADGKIRPLFALPENRSVIAHQGQYVVLMALMRGVPGELANDDLAFALRRIEDHFRDKFQQEGSALLYPLQPFLEDCLLIQAPASAA